MRSYNTDLIQVELAKHDDGRWHLQATYYDREGNDERFDGWYTLGESPADGWDRDLSLLARASIINALLMAARHARPRLQRPGA